jgi:hypothetical protein
MRRKGRRRCLPVAAREETLRGNSAREKSRERARDGAARSAHFGGLSRSSIFGAYSLVGIAPLRLLPNQTTVYCGWNRSMLLHSPSKQHHNASSATYNALTFECRPVPLVPFVLIDSPNQFVHCCVHMRCCCHATAVGHITSHGQPVTVTQHTAPSNVISPAQIPGRGTVHAQRIPGSLVARLGQPQPPVGCGQQAGQQVANSSGVWTTRRPPRHADSRARAPLASASRPAPTEW